MLDITDTPDADPAPPLLAILGKLLPEVTLALAAVALQIWPERVGPFVIESLTMVALTEVMFSLAQGTLTDIATRLRKRPPLWAIVPIVIGFGLFFPETFTMLRGAFAEGWAVFVPFAWSVLERLREMWTMPDAPRLEKMRRRALVGGRITIVLVFGFAGVAVAGVTYLLGWNPGGIDLLSATAGWWLAAAFATAAADILSVHRPAFARRPRALLHFMDPLGVEYLEPVG